ncbi:hypothetical protein FF38_02984 [Lucilia cuprina]|uniref:Uncharacterized protein n=1 Tax=Lucilia cuprina TaxID=7375 RepID=A0A0L0CN27_LUCCU|nr:hypothetical protein FF38_02984 [Lucilia cuprina]
MDSGLPNVLRATARLPSEMQDVHLPKHSQRRDKLNVHPCDRHIGYNHRRRKLNIYKRKKETFLCNAFNSPSTYSVSISKRFKRSVSIVLDQKTSSLVSSMSLDEDVGSSLIILSSKVSSTFFSVELSRCCVGITGGSTVGTSFIGDVAMFCSIESLLFEIICSVTFKSISSVRRLETSFGPTSFKALFLGSSICCTALGSRAGSTAGSSAESTPS